LISKILKGTTALGLVKYMYSARDSEGRAREQIVDLGGTIAGSTVAEIGAQFRALASLRPQLRKTTAHLMLRWTEEDRPSTAEQAMMAKQHAETMGFRHWRATGHGDHLHIGASRVNSDSSVVTDSDDFLKGETSRAELEIRFGLTRVAPSHLRDPQQRMFHVAVPSREELALAQKGEPSVRLQLQEAITVALGSGATFAEFANELWSLGVEARPNLQKTGRVAGVSFVLSGVEMAGSSLGRSFSWVNLKKRGLDYEQARDCEIIGQCLERVARLADREGSRPNCGPDPRGEGNLDTAVAADRKIPGQSFDRHEGNPGFDFENDFGTSASISQENHRSDAGSREIGDLSASGVVGRPEQGHAGGGVRAAGGQISSPPSLVGGGNNGDGGGNSAERVVSRFRGGDRISAVGAAESFVGPLKTIAVAETLGQQLRNQEGSMVPQHERKETELGRSGVRHLATSALISGDYTMQQVRRQVEAFNCDAFEIGVLPPRHRLDLKAQALRIFTALQLVSDKLIQWLKRMNAVGYDIYCRPAAPADRMRQPLVFIDDLSMEKIEKMKRSGLPIAILVESSPENFHGWVRVGEDPISAEEALCAARTLAALYGGDAGAVSSRQFGRLSGFTNKKAKHQVSRGAPFAMLRNSTTAVAPAGPEFLETVRGAIAKGAQTIVANQDRTGASFAENPTAVTAFLSARAKTRVLRADRVTDESAADFGAAASMLCDRWQSSEIVAAILLSSPNLEKRHRDVQDYAKRTVAAAERSVAAYSSAGPVPVLKPRG
jgi:hypothetical protein